MCSWSFRERFLRFLTCLVLHGIASSLYCVGLGVGGIEYVQIAQVGECRENDGSLETDFSQKTIAVSPKNNVVVTASVFSWLASEEVASIWTHAVNVGNPVVLFTPSFDFKWDYGFRIGIGYNLSHDDWDMICNWSWFDTSATNAVSPKPLTWVFPEFDAAFLSGNSCAEMAVRWDLLFNMFDWGIGKGCWVSQDLFLRPFVGLKGGWIHQSIQATYDHLIKQLVFVTDQLGKEKLKNNFWGIGPLGGIETKWRIGMFGSHFLDLCGDLSAATMWGVWSCSDVYRDTLSQSISVDTKNDFLGALMFGGFFGFGWEVDFRNNRSHFAAKLGYEMQLWLNQLRVATFQLQRLHHDLTLQGITFNVRYDY